MKIVTRQEAKAAGLKRYFTGKPCKNGHIAERQLTNSACIVCRDARSAQWWASNPDKSREYNQRWYAANREQEIDRALKRQTMNPERKRENSNRWNRANPEPARERAAQWRVENPEQAREGPKKWRTENPDKHNANNQRRRAWKVGALCSCCTSADFRSIYNMAHVIGLEVDHIQPLALGGAHCRHNLQLLTPEDHRAKTNHDIRRIAEARRQERERRG